MTNTMTPEESKEYAMATRIEPRIRGEDKQNVAYVQYSDTPLNYEARQEEILKARTELVKQIALYSELEKSKPKAMDNAFYQQRKQYAMDSIENISNYLRAMDENPAGEPSRLAKMKDIYGKAKQKLIDATPTLRRCPRVAALRLASGARVSYDAGRKACSTFGAYARRNAPVITANARTYAGRAKDYTINATKAVATSTVKAGRAAKQGIQEQIKEAKAQEELRKIWASREAQISNGGVDLDTRLQALHNAGRNLREFPGTYESKDNVVRFARMTAPGVVEGYLIDSVNGTVKKYKITRRAVI